MNDLDGLLHRMVEAGAGKTLAIFIGWRGEIWKWCGICSLDNRRAAAGEIGNSDALADFLGNVAKAGRDVNANVIFTGHSLGAALLEKTAAKMITAAGTNTKSPRLPDLFLLANSAEISDTSVSQVEAINNSTLAKRKAEGTQMLSPVVLAVTSTNDKADMWGNSLNSYYLLGKVQSTLGFDRRLWSHRLKADDAYAQGPYPGKTLEQTQIDLSREVLIVPTFWAPDPARTKLIPYRIMPYPLSKRKGIFPKIWNYLMPGSLKDFKPSDTPNEIFWNLSIPREISKGHNDVYNNMMLGAAISWLRLAKPETLAQLKLPDNIPALLTSLQLTIHAASRGATGEANERPMMRQLVLGAAARMPRNAGCIHLILSELDHAKPVCALNAAELERYRINLFYILKFTVEGRMSDVAADKFGWSAKNIERLKELLQRPQIRLSLKRAGNAKDDHSPETDKYLNAFYAFLLQHGISLS